MTPDPEEPTNRPIGPGTFRWWKALESGALAVGSLLIAVYSLGMGHRLLGARLALNRFDAATASGVDFSLWSERRTDAYRESLLLLKEDPIAVLSIGRLQVRVPVFAGTDELVLNRGAGWISGTAKPGDQGNSGIAGHRDGFFRALKDVVVGDAVELSTPQARLLYRVDEIEIVSPKDVSVLRPRGMAALTLVSCFPFYYAGNAPRRFIVHAKLERE